ncbi:MAG: nitroreductase family deazaflavin-dependent oxidoreductase [Anaerolineae bacterium]
MESSQNPVIPYPAGILRIVLRAPLLLFRLGLGDVLNGLRLLVLTTRGRKSGTARHTAIEYRRHGSKIYLISGWGNRPDWYQNLLTDPLATVQLGRNALSVLADPVDDPAEALRVVNLFRRNAPARYDAVLGRLIDSDISGRTLPDVSPRFTIVRLNIIPDEPTLPGLQTDKVWMWPVAVIGLFMMFVLISRSEGRTAKDGKE